MDEADVKTRRALSDTTRRKPHTLLAQPGDGRGQIIDPQPDVVQGRGVHRGFFLGVQRLHEIHLDLEWPDTDGADVLVDVFSLAPEGARDLQAEQVDPEFLQPMLVRTTNGNLLNTQHFEGTVHRQPHSNSTMTWSTASDSPLAATTFFTTPSCAAKSAFSIFMASITATRSPACTFCPT